MTKSQLLEKFKNELSRLPKDELESRLAFYGEMIDDRIEEGLSEEEAVAAIGDIDAIISQLKSEYSTVREKVTEEKAEKKPENQKSRKISAWAIILIILGSPIWLSLGAAALVVLISVYVVIWSVTGSLWSLPASLAGVCLGGLATGIISIIVGKALLGIALIGAAIACAGLAIFSGFGCFHLTRLAVFLSKTIARFIISLFTGKEKKNA